MKIQTGKLLKERDENPFAYVLRTLERLDPKTASAVAQAKTLTGVAISQCTNRAVPPDPDYLREVVEGVRTRIRALKKADAAGMSYAKLVISELEPLSDFFAARLPEQEGQWPDGRSPS